MRFITALIAWLTMVWLITTLPLILAWLLKERFWIVIFSLLAIAILLALLQSLICLADITGIQADFRYQQIRSFLNQSFEGWDSVGLNSEQGIISLSYLAEGLVSYSIRRPSLKSEIVSLTKKAVKIAIRVAPFHDVNNPAEWGESGLYLSHLNVILGAYQHLTGEHAYFTLNRNVSEYLSQKMVYGYCNQFSS